MCVLNPVALVPSQEQDLAKLFLQNYHEIEYPKFGIGSFVRTGIEPQKNENMQ